MEPINENFNPHPREGGDPSRRLPRRDAGNFNPHPREGGDAGRSNEYIHHVPISIHTPAKGVTFVAFKAGMAIQDFNPHPREGGDHGAGAGVLPVSGISIHTPAKGVTEKIADAIQFRNISIHTPAKGVTHRLPSAT